MFPEVVPSLNIYTGDTFEQAYRFKTNGNSINLVEDGWSNWKCFIKSTPDSETGFEVDIDLSEASSGRIVLSIAAADTETVPAGYFDVQAENNGVVKTWISGSVRLRKGVTE